MTVQGKEVVTEGPRHPATRSNRAQRERIRRRRRRRSGYAEGESGSVESRSGRGRGRGSGDDRGEYVELDATDSD